MDLKMVRMDGSTASPSVQDQTLLWKAQVLIQAEMNAGMPSSTFRYLYLQYDVPGVVPQERWAHWGKADHLNWKSRQVTVQQD